MSPGGSQAELPEEPADNKQFYNNHAHKLRKELDSLSPFAADIYGLSRQKSNMFEIKIAPENIHIQWPKGAQDSELESLGLNPAD